MYAKSHITYLY